MKLLLLATAAVAIPGVSLLAESVAPASAFATETTLVGQGVVGAILAWFMLRNEKHREMSAREFVGIGERIAKNGEKIDRLSKVILIQTMTHPDFPAAAQQQASSLLKEIDKDAP